MSENGAPAMTIDLLDKYREEGYEHQYNIGGCLYYRLRHLARGGYRVDRREIGESWKTDGPVFDDKSKAIDHIEAGLRDRFNRRNGLRL